MCFFSYYYYCCSSLTTICWFNFSFLFLLDLTKFSQEICLSMNKSCSFRMWHRRVKSRRSLLPTATPRARVKAKTVCHPIWGSQERPLTIIRMKCSHRPANCSLEWRQPLAMSPKPLLKIQEPLRWQWSTRLKMVSCCLRQTSSCTSSQLTKLTSSSDILVGAQLQ